MDNKTDIKIYRYDKYKVIIGVNIMADKCVESQPAALTFCSNTETGPNWMSRLPALSQLLT